jgi:tripartite-type tricarboxylate transporter receptor subunit TctC
VRKWIATSIGLALLVGGTAQGQTSKDVYPNRPVRMIVPFGAGGPGDIFARLIGKKLSEQLGQQFVIENRPGAGGNIGAGIAARAPADGYTLLIGSSTLWVNASLYPQIPYDPVRDFEPIIIGATSPEVLVVHPSVPAKTVQELVALVRAGKYNNFAIAGAGTPPHLSTELFRLSLKLDIVTVPFGGGGPMVQSVVGGHTPVAFATLPSASALRELAHQPGRHDHGGAVRHACGRPRHGRSRRGGRDRVYDLLERRAALGRPEFSHQDRLTPASPRGCPHGLRLDLIGAAAIT